MQEVRKKVCKINVLSEHGRNLVNDCDVLSRVCQNQFERRTWSTLQLFPIIGQFDFCRNGHLDITAKDVKRQPVRNGYDGSLFQPNESSTDF